MGTHSFLQSWSTLTILFPAAFLVYYWLLSAFFWLNVTSFNVWRSVV